MVAHLDDAVGVRLGGFTHCPLAGDARRPRLLEKEMLPRGEHLACPHRMVDGPSRDHDGVDVVGREELAVGRGPDAELRRRLFCTFRARRCDRDEPGTRKPEHVAGVQRAHPAEPGDADPQHSSLVTLDTAMLTMSASQSLAQSFEADA